MPIVGNCLVYKSETPNYDIFVNIVEDRETHLPIQLFINAGMGGSDEMAWADALARLLTALLQSGMTMPNILQLIDGITTVYKSSGPMKVAEILERYWKEKLEEMINV